MQFLFIGIGVIEAFPIIGLGFALYLFFAIAQPPLQAALAAAH
jgi:F0F1-type ATP synthase membrane subunit c/vacuolar-type H+-ATPase subunit K